jgi:hypothetical protein
MNRTRLKTILQAINFSDSTSLIKEIEQDGEKALLIVNHFTESTCMIIEPIPTRPGLFNIREVKDRDKIKELIEGGRDERSNDTQG